MSGIGQRHNKFTTCKGCPHRTIEPNCHTTCEGYKARRKKIEEQKRLADADRRAAMYETEKAVNLHDKMRKRGIK